MKLEIWADSFHEGDWACRQLMKVLISQGGNAKIDYLYGFLPNYYFKGDDWELEIIVFGSYNAWEHLPEKIKSLNTWGKPDFIAFDPEKDEILFAVEETAAVPTGNQALQRCERLFGSAFNKIPFWYLLSEFGTHVDGGIRRDSIWPSIMALKLSFHFNVPSIVLHYSDKENPEGYEFGKGVELLFKALLKILENYSKGLKPLEKTEEILASHYKDMIGFVESQHKNILTFLPGREVLNEKDLPDLISEKLCGKINPKKELVLKSFLSWPLIKNLPTDEQNRQSEGELIKFDSLAQKLEKDVGNGKAYCLNKRAGSRPQSKDKIEGWIKDQKNLHKKGPPLIPPYEFDLKVEHFPESASGNLHLTTAKNIVYLYDRWEDLEKSIIEAFPRLEGKINIFYPDKPLFFYLSNSIKPGRIFGDPFTGQIAAYGSIFGKLDSLSRGVIAYFPHQVFTQAVTTDGRVPNNKGLTIMKELTDLLLFHGGVAVNLKKGEIY